MPAEEEDGEDADGADGDRRRANEARFGDMESEIGAEVRIVLGTGKLLLALPFFLEF